MVDHFLAINLCFTLFVEYNMKSWIDNTCPTLKPFKKLPFS